MISCTLVFRCIQKKFQFTTRISFAKVGGLILGFFLTFVKTYRSARLFKILGGLNGPNHSTLLIELCQDTDFWLVIKGSQTKHSRWRHWTCENTENQNRIVSLFKNDSVYMLGIRINVTSIDFVYCRVSLLCNQSVFWYQWDLRQLQSLQQRFQNSSRYKKG